MRISEYAKYLVAILGVVLAAIAAALADEVISADEAVNLAVIALGAFATYLVPNLPTGIGQYAKAGVGALTAGATLLASLLTQGVTLSEWLMVGAAIVTAVTTYVVPNAGTLAAVVNVYPSSTDTGAGEGNAGIARASA